MAGFAVFMTIVTYGFLFIVLATIASITLVLFAKKRVPRDAHQRRAFLVVCGIAPFVGLLWLIAAILIHVQISNKWAHQDCGLSGDPYVTLPNGYVLGSLNTYSGYIVAPGFNTDAPFTGPGYVRSLIDIQWTGDYFVGTYSDEGNKQMRFRFNTRDRSIQTSDTGISVSFEQVQTLVHQDANSYWSLYAQYRHHWPNYILAFLILAGEDAIVLVLWRRWAMLQRRVAEI